MRLIIFSDKYNQYSNYRARAVASAPCLILTPLVLLEDYFLSLNVEKKCIDNIRPPRRARAVASAPCLILTPLVLLEDYFLSLNVEKKCIDNIRPPRRARAVASAPCLILTPLVYHLC